MKYMRRTAGYTWTVCKTNAQIAEELKITQILDKVLEYKRSWIQHVNRMPRNRLPRVMKQYSPTGRRNHGRPLKRLLDTWDRNGSTSGPTSWQIYYYYYMDVSCHRPFLPGTSLEPAVIHTAQASSFTLLHTVWCSKYSCFCIESIEYFPGTASKFFFRLLVTIPVISTITGIIVHFRFHIHCISIHKLLYFNFFPLPFAQHFCPLLPLLLLLYSTICPSTYLHVS